MLRNDGICSDAEAITPSNSTQGNWKGLYIGTTGNVAVVTAGGTTTVFTAVPAGGIIPLEVVQVRSTSTTASNIVGFKS